MTLVGLTHRGPFDDLNHQQRTELPDLATSKATVVPLYLIWRFGGILATLQSDLF